MGKFTFSQALASLMVGAKVARQGWNGKGMFIYLEKGSHDFSDNDPDKSISGVPAQFFERGNEGTTTRLPHINMKAADGSTVVGWLASQTDMLANDWGTVE